MKGDPEQRAVQLGEYIVAHHATVRGAAQAFGCSKSTVHKDVSTRLRAVSPGLFLSLIHIFTVRFGSVEKKFLLPAAIVQGYLTLIEE